MDLFSLDLSHNDMLWTLLALMLVTWAALGYKVLKDARFEAQNVLFLKEFWTSADLLEAREVSWRRDCAAARLARTGFKLLESSSTDDSSRSNSEPLKGCWPCRETFLRRRLRRQISGELRRIESGLLFLVLVGMTCPSVSLTGALWDIRRSLESNLPVRPETLAVFSGQIDATMAAAAIGFAASMSALLGAYFVFRRVGYHRRTLEDFAEDFFRLARENGFTVPPLLAPSPEVPPAKAGSPKTGGTYTYGEILRSSALMGGSSLLNVLIGILRTKAMAVLVGPAGVGLMGLYGSISDLAQNIAGLGIQSSGVRQIAEAAGSGDTRRVARIAVVVQRMSVLLGVLGAALLWVFSPQAATLTFGGDQRAGSVALLSLAVLFGCVGGGQVALVQGMRRISDLAKMGVVGALSGTVIAIPLVYLLREDGVVPALVSVAATGAIVSWWYRRKIPLEKTSVTISQVGQEAAALIKFGLAFMGSGLLMTCTLYAIRVIVLRAVSAEAVGFYQAAWNLGGMYVGFVLNAMGAEFGPRICAVGKDSSACNRMVNEAVQVSLLLAGPGVIATLTFAPLVIGVFYSGKFDPAVGILRWICLGVALRVIAWPMGSIILVTGTARTFFLTDLAWALVHAAFAWACVTAFGLDGTGMAFFASYVFSACLIYAIVRRLTGFRWSPANRKTGLLFLSLTTLVFFGFYWLPVFIAYTVGVLSVILSSAYSIRTLIKLVAIEGIPRPVLRFVAWLRPA